MVSIPHWLNPAAWLSRSADAPDRRRAPGLSRAMRRADEIVAIRARLADQLNKLGIGGSLPRPSFEQPIADALGLDEYADPARAEALASRFAERVSALISEGRRPADALRAAFGEFASVSPQLRAPRVARQEIALILSSPSTPAAADHVSEEAVLARIAAEQDSEHASDAPIDQLNLSQSTRLVELYNELLWARMGPNGLLHPADDEAVRTAVVSTFIALSGSSR